MADALNDVGFKKLLPHSVEAERYVLGACLKSKDVFAKALETLEGEDFYKNSSKKIFAAMSNLFESSEEIDILTLSERLRKDGDLEVVGGMDFLDHLDDLAPTSGALTHHVNIVRDKRVLRDLINSATNIVNQGYEDSEEVQVLLDKAETSIFQISEKKSKRTFFTIKEVLNESFESIEKLFERPGLVTGVETGFVESLSEYRIDKRSSPVAAAVKSEVPIRRPMTSLSTPINRAARPAIAAIPREQ